MKPITASATISDRARRLLENRETAREICRKVHQAKKDGSRKFTVAGESFSIDRPVK